jgi:hypothetical protein
MPSAADLNITEQKVGKARHDGWSSGVGRGICERMKNPLAPLETTCVYLSERNQEGGFSAQRAGAGLPRHAGLSGRWLLNGCPANCLTLSPNGLMVRWRDLQNCFFIIKSPCRVEGSKQG